MRSLILALLLLAAPLSGRGSIGTSAQCSSSRRAARSPASRRILEPRKAYEIRRSIAELVASVPEARKYARIETEQFTNISSTNITPAHWLQLARRINNVFRERSDLAGIVITHGTARLDETAFFLNLVVKSDRPVVLVGAQRPPTGISPDGALNLLAAIRVAASP